MASSDTSAPPPAVGAALVAITEEMGTIRILELLAAQCSHAASVAEGAKALYGAFKPDRMFGRDNERKAALQAGAVPLLFSAIAGHVENADVCKSCLVAVEDVIGELREQGTDAALEVKGEAYVVAALRAHAANNEIVTIACKTLRMMSGTKIPRVLAFNAAGGGEMEYANANDALLAAGVMSVYVTIATTFSGDSDVRTAATRAMLALSGSLEAFKSAALAAEAVPVLVANAKRGLADCEYAKMALEQLGFTPDGTPM